MATFSVTNSFVANTKAKSAEVNQNFTDVLAILTAHHHDPNIYSGASPITTSGIAANAQIKDTQLASPITRSGLISSSAMQVLAVGKGGTGLCALGNDNDILTTLNGAMAWQSAGSIFPTGGVIAWTTRAAPTGFLLANGTAVSRTTYANLFAVIVPQIGTFTVTIASPAVFSKTAHGLVLGDAVYFTTSSALPTGLSANTIYYVIAAGLTADAFEVSATRGGAAINTSGSQSGTHTLWQCPYGLGDGSTTFNVPDLGQRVPVGYKAGDTYNYTQGITGGEQTHVLTAAELASHTHTVPTTINSGGGSSVQHYAGSDGSQITTNANAGGDGAHNNLQPYLTMNFIIKT